MYTPKEYAAVLATNMAGLLKTISQIRHRRNGTKKNSATS